MIAREDLLYRLQTVAPALSERPALVPEMLGRVCFDGEHVTAYNDRIGLSTPLKTNFIGAVPGKFLIDMLKVSTDLEEVEIFNEGNAMHLTAGGTLLEMPALPLERFLFAMPKPNAMSDLDDAFFDAIDDCLLSVGTGIKSIRHADHMGITLMPDGDGLALFSIDGVRMTQVVLKKTALKLKKGALLSTEFCKQMLRLKGERNSLAINDKYALYTNGSEALFGRLIESEKPLRFFDIVKRGLADANGNYTAASNDLRSVLKLASNACDGKTARSLTEIKVGKDGEATFISNGGRYGRLTDRCKLPGHPPVETAFPAPLVLEGLVRYEQVLFTKATVIMTRGSATYIVAARG